jgi:tripartite-type tricarboxylate transporter receptor subunit TctC
VPSLLGGHVDVLVQLPAALSAHVGEGSLRLLAALTPERDPALPDVPTAREQGVDAALPAWRGLAAPPRTPKPVVATLEASIGAVAASRDFAEASARLGVTPAFLPADAFASLIAREDETLAQLMKVMAIAK